MTTEEELRAIARRSLNLIVDGGAAERDTPILVGAFTTSLGNSLATRIRQRRPPDDVVLLHVVAKGAAH